MQAEHKMQNDSQTPNDNKVMQNDNIDANDNKMQVYN